MLNARGIFIIYPESFRANKYTKKPFRMIGLIDVGIMYTYSIERVTLAYFRSSGTNSGKIRGLWYPIVGIKQYSGKFTEFTEYINYILTEVTKDGEAGEGWLAKSLFFSKAYLNDSKIRGFSNGVYYKGLLWVGETLRVLYEEDKFENMKSLTSSRLNSIITSEKIYEGNSHTQKENFEKFVEDIFNYK